MEWNSKQRLHNLKQLRGMTKFYFPWTTAILKTFSMLRQSDLRLWKYHGHGFFVEEMFKFFIKNSILLIELLENQQNTKDA